MLKKTKFQNIAGEVVLHFFSQRLHRRSESSVKSFALALPQPAKPQNLHVQFGQCQSPAGRICSGNKGISTSSVNVKYNYSKKKNILDKKYQ